MDLAGQTLVGKYELTRMLGKGGMGEVWEGEHALTGRRVAVKILSDRYLSNKKVVARFGREARAASAVQHDGIVEILDQDRTEDGVPFLVMEFLAGESVGQRIKRLGKLSQDEALAIVLPLLDALDAAHKAGIIHRDLKPDNVFILPGARGDERIKILDFGISQKSDEIEHNLTQEGSVLGTPHYMSPEQARGEANIDGRVDVYAVGVMFYECVVGDVPFDASNYNALLQIILGQAPPSPRSRGAEITPALEQVILSAMDKRRERRPPDARAFHALLLEAGMQEDDALLDVDSWTFSTPSGPPPPVDFGPDQLTDSVPPLPRAAASDEPSRPRADSLFPHLPGAFLEDEKPLVEGSAGGARGLSPLGPAGAAARRALADAGAPRPSRPQAFELDDARGTFALPGTATELAPLPLAEEPVARAPRRDPATGTRPLAARATEGALPLPRRTRPTRSGEIPTQSGPGVLRSLMGWVLALAALLALAYLANTVFTRPDPRKLRKAVDPAAAGAPAAQEGAPSPSPPAGR